MTDRLPDADSHRQEGARAALLYVGDRLDHLTADMRRSSGWRNPHLWIALAVALAVQIGTGIFFISRQAALLEKLEDAHNEEVADRKAAVKDVREVLDKVDFLVGRHLRGEDGKHSWSGDAR